MQDFNQFTQNVKIQSSIIQPNNLFPDISQDFARFPKLYDAFSKLLQKKLKSDLKLEMCNNYL